MIKQDGSAPSILIPAPPVTRLSLEMLKQPLLAFAALSAACFWLVIPSHKLCTAGRVLGEHWYSVYNCMLFAATVLFFVTAKKKNRPELGWRVWDITLCCAILSLGFKLVPLPRPDGGPHGFPSGHCLTAFAVSCLLMRKFPKLSQYAFAIAVAVGWSRVEIREHFVYQVLFGAIFGIVVGLAVALAEDNLGVLLPRLLRGRKREPDLRDAALRLLGRASRSSSED